MLKDALGGQGGPSIEALVDTVLLPLFEMSEGGDAGELAFLRVLARSTMETDPALLEVLSTTLRPYVEFSVMAFEMALPNIGRDELSLRIVCMMGAISHAFTDDARRELFGGSPRTRDPRFVYSSMRAFLVAGLSAAPAAEAGTNGGNG